MYRGLKSSPRRTQQEHSTSVVQRQAMIILFTLRVKYHLVEHCTGIAEVTGSNPVEALIFFSLLLSSCLSWKIYSDDHSSLSSTTAVQI